MRPLALVWCPGGNWELLRYCSVEIHAPRFHRWLSHKDMLPYPQPTPPALLGNRSLVHPLYTPCAYGPLTLPIRWRLPAALRVSGYGPLDTFTVTWAGAVTGWSGQVGQGLTSRLTVDPKLWIAVVPPEGGGGKLSVNAKWLAFVR